MALKRRKKGKRRGNVGKRGPLKGTKQKFKGDDLTLPETPIPGVSTDPPGKQKRQDARRETAAHRREVLAERCGKATAGAMKMGVREMDDLIDEDELMERFKIERPHVVRLRNRGLPYATLGTKRRVYNRRHVCLFMQALMLPKRLDAGDE